MVFSSITFLLYFLPLFLLSYYLVGAKLKNIVVLLFSVAFYSWGAPKFIFILLASTYLDFYLVRWMHQCTDQKRKQLLLILSITLNLGLLAFFKYANFFIENVNGILAQFGQTSVQWTKIVLPIGISFYTFQTLTYSIDVYRKVHKPLDKVNDYMLYIIMFPQLIAGPIVRFNYIADQITNREASYNDRVLGFIRFCIGLAKKILIANVMGAKADEIMALDFNEISSSTAWLGIIAYTFQIYFDFSGYSDMAIGIGRMIGFKFPENFNNPYVSKSITEFWRRWHITLGAWMRDYLYIPLGGSKVNSKHRLYFNLWFVFLVSGLWHGASWNFVIWGAYHGLFLILERLFLKNVLTKLGKPFSVIFTFFIVMLGWVIFRIEEFDTAMLFYQKLFAFNFDMIQLKGNQEFFTILMIAIFFAFFTISKKGQALHDRVFFSYYSKRFKLSVFTVSSVLFILSVSALSTSGFNPFIYFRF